VTVAECELHTCSPCLRAQRCGGPSCRSNTPGWCFEPRPRREEALLDWRREAASLAYDGGMQLALARAARARSKLRLWALSLAGLLAVCVSFTLSLQHHHQLHRPTHHRFRTNEGFRHRDHHAATTAAALEPHQVCKRSARGG
jgi:hypothetical protein